MQAVMCVIYAIVIVPFVVLGFVFLRGKGADLIAGYNTSSPAKKAKTDEKALCRFMGKAMFVFAACWLILASGTILEITPLFWVGLGLFFLAVIFVLIYCSTGNRFAKKH